MYVRLDIAIFHPFKLDIIILQWTILVIDQNKKQLGYLESLCYINFSVKNITVCLASIVIIFFLNHAGIKMIINNSVNIKYINLSYILFLTDLQNQFSWSESTLIYEHKSIDILKA